MGEQIKWIQSFSFCSISVLQAAYEKELIDKSLPIVLSSDEGITKNGLRVLSHELKGISESEPPSQGVTFHG